MSYKAAHHEVNRFCELADQLSKKATPEAPEKTPINMVKHGIAATITAGIALTGKTILKALHIIS